MQTLEARLAAVELLLAWVLGAPDATHVARIKALADQFDPETDEGPWPCTAETRQAMLDLINQATALAALR